MIIFTDHSEPDPNPIFLTVLTIAVFELGGNSGHTLQTIRDQIREDGLDVAKFSDEDFDSLVKEFVDTNLITHNDKSELLVNSVLYETVLAFQTRSPANSQSP